MKEFVNDEEVIGKWEFYARIRNDEEFQLEQAGLEYKDIDFKEIYFLPHGEPYWIFEGWTKGYLYIHYGGNEPILTYHYKIKTIDGHAFLFLEQTINHAEYIHILIKTSSKKYKLSEIGRRENIDLPFLCDPLVIGEWKSVGFVNQIEKFTGSEEEGLWLSGIIFQEDGQAIRLYEDEVWKDCWTKGYLMDQKKSVACAYFFQEIQDTTYLFLEWKMGNYVYGGKEADYYIFKRKNSRA